MVFDQAGADKYPIARGGGHRQIKGGALLIIMLFAVLNGVEQGVGAKSDSIGFASVFMNGDEVSLSCLRSGVA